MTRLPLPAPVRASVALTAVAGVVFLSGCGATTDAGADSQTDTGADSSTSTSTGSTGESYADGTYTAEGSYATPESVETIQVTLTLADDLVTEVSVVGDPEARESERYQEEFIGGISAEVVGQNIEELEVSRVGGSSLTSGGFNQALEVIKSDAAL